MKKDNRAVFEVEMSIEVDDDEKVSWLKVKAANADELADALSGHAVSFCPVAGEVPDQNIDFRLPEDRIALQNNVRNWYMGIY